MGPAITIPWPIAQNPLPGGKPMDRPSPLAPICLVVGALLGLAGSFVPSASLRGLAWGIDGTALTVGAALLAVHFIRRGQDLPAAGFLVFIAGQALGVSRSGL